MALSTVGLVDRLPSSNEIGVLGRDPSVAFAAFVTRAGNEKNRKSDEDEGAYRGPPFDCPGRLMLDSVPKAATERRGEKVKELALAEVSFFGSPAPDDS